MKWIVAAMAALAFSTGAALAADEALIQEGEAQMRKECGSCHRVEGPDGLIGKAKGKTGPNLYGLPGRTAGVLETYASKSGKIKFKDGLITAGEKGLVWDLESLTAYVENPKKFIRDFTGDKKARVNMAARKKADVAAIYAYLESVSQ